MILFIVFFVLLSCREFGVGSVGNVGKKYESMKVRKLLINKLLYCFIASLLFGWWCIEVLRLRNPNHVGFWLLSDKRDV